jgi:hypothetical protein
MNLTYAIVALFAAVFLGIVDATAITDAINSFLGGFGL